VPYITIAQVPYITITQVPYITITQVPYIKNYTGVTGVQFEQDNCTGVTGVQFEQEQRDHTSVRSAVVHAPFPQTVSFSCTTQAHTHMHTHAYHAGLGYTHTNIYKHAHAYTHTRTHTHMRTHTNTHTHAHLCICLPLGFGHVFSGLGFHVFTMESLSCLDFLHGSREGRGGHVLATLSGRTGCSVCVCYVLCCVLCLWV
jgi:hypothetical protein